MNSPFDPAGARGTEASRRYRVVLWGYTGLFIACIAGFIAMQRGDLPRDLKPFAALGFLGALAGFVVTFRAGTAASREERARAERQAMLVLMASELNKQDDAALEQISRKSGMAGEAATWILAERANKRRRAAPDAFGLE